MLKLLKSKRVCRAISGSLSILLFGLVTTSHTHYQGNEYDGYRLMGAFVFAVAGLYALGVFERERS